MGKLRKVKGAFKKIGKGFAVFGRALFGREGLRLLGEATQAVLLSKAGAIALELVQELAASGFPVRAEAFQRIRQRAKATGLEIKDSFVNLLIELAVQRIKSATAEDK